MRLLIDKLIEIKQVETSVLPGEYDLEWIGGFEINPRDREAALWDHCRARALQTNYMTVNEIRAEEGLDDIDGGDVILGLVKAQTALYKAKAAGSNIKSNKNSRERSRRKAELEKKFGKPVKYLLMERINRRDSVHRICEDLGISTDTYYRWVNEYGLY